MERPWSHPPNCELGLLCRSGSASCNRRLCRTSSLSGSKQLLAQLVLLCCNNKALSAALLLHSCWPQASETCQEALSPLLRAEDPPAHPVVPEPAATVHLGPPLCLGLHLQRKKQLRKFCYIMKKPVLAVTYSSPINYSIN